MRQITPTLLCALLLASGLAFAGTTPATSASPAKPATSTGKPANLRCHDKSGRFVACPKETAKKAQCRDAKGKFVACPK